MKQPTKKKIQNTSSISFSDEKYVGKHRNFCFTAWEVPTFLGDKMDYMIYQHEKCPTTGKSHYQGYVECKVELRYNEARKLLPKDSWVQCRHGTQEQAIVYCKKIESAVGKPIEYGKPKRQGNRTDLDSIFDCIQSGMTKKEILMEFRGHGMRYVSHISKTMEIMWGKDETDREIIALRKTAKELGYDEKCIKP